MKKMLALSSDPLGTSAMAKELKLLLPPPMETPVSTTAVYLNRRAADSPHRWQRWTGRLTRSFSTSLASSPVARPVGARGEVCRVKVARDTAMTCYSGVRLTGVRGRCMAEASTGSWCSEA